MIFFRIFEKALAYRSWN